MLKLFKSDIYRLSKTTSFKVILVISALLALFSVGFSNMIINIMPAAASSTQELQAMASVYPALGWHMNGGTDILTFLNVVYGTGALFVAALFAALFFSSEHEKGFDKNIAGQIPNRGAMVVSKLFTLAVINVIIFAVYVLVGTAAGMLMLPVSIGFTFSAKALAVLGINLLNSFAISAIVTAMCIITNSKTAGIVFSIVFGFGVSTMIYSIANTALVNIAKVDNVDLSKFFPDGATAIASGSPTIANVAVAAGVCIAFIAVLTIVASMIMKKRDVK